MKQKSVQVLLTELKQYFVKVLVDCTYCTKNKLFKSHLKYNGQNKVIQSRCL